MKKISRIQDVKQAREKIRERMRGNMSVLSAGVLKDVIGAGETM